MWFLGGIIVVLSSLILDKQPNLTIFLIVTGIITIIPIVYSYIVFEKEKKRHRTPHIANCLIPLNRKILVLLKQY